MYKRFIYIIELLLLYFFFFFFVNETSSARGQTLGVVADSKI